MTESKIEVETSISPQKQLYHIDIAIIDLVSHQKVKYYLAEILSRAVRTVLMEKYGDIQRIVDNVILSKETKEFIQKTIHEEIIKIIKESIKEMFEGK